MVCLTGLVDLFEGSKKPAVWRPLPWSVHIFWYQVTSLGILTPALSLPLLSSLPVCKVTNEQVEVQTIHI